MREEVVLTGSVNFVVKAVEGYAGEELLSGARYLGGISPSRTVG